MRSGLLVTALSVLAVAASSVEGLAPLKRNIAYRSPTVVHARGLAHDIDSIGRNIVKRSAMKKRDSSSALGGHAADQLVIDYDSETGIDGQDAYRGEISFPYKVASGDPYDDSAILWTHPVPAENTSDPICLRYQTSRVKDSWKKQHLADSSYAWTTSDVDYSFKVETTNLKPLTQYYYRFFACHDHSQVSPTGTFKTMPHPDDASVKSLKMGVFSCSNYPFGYFTAFGKAAESDIDLAVFVGDYIYENPGDGSPGAYGNGTSLNRVPEPNKEIVTLEEYRIRYSVYRSDKDLQALHQKKAWLLIWDDHEVADNSYKAGSAISNDTEAGTIDGVRFTERKKNAVKAYFEWMPIRQVDTYSDTLRIWRKFQYGKLADISMLDTRNFDRDITDLYYNTDEIAAMSNETSRSLMGGKQEKWLYNNLVHSKERGATWRIVGQQIVVTPLFYGTPSFNVNYDSWDGYEANRRRMFDTIRENNIDNVIFLSGDSHATWVSDLIYKEWVNRTDLYDAASGEGSVAVEFAGTAVTSPSSYGATLTPAQYRRSAERLVTINRQLAYAEGGNRGYYTLHFTPDQVDAKFWGIQNVTIPDSDQFLVAQFNVKKGANKLTRPLNYGIEPAGGAIQAQVIDYSKQKWNGTAYA